MAKYSYEFKKMIVDAYLNGEEAINIFHLSMVQLEEIYKNGFTIIKL